jgi:predicted regulator of Ras-like GTPase activity (Roadblock/LC7/MglB family)
MADFYDLLARAVAQLPKSTPETRKAIYDRARKALSERLSEPPVTGENIDRELRSLDDAIARVEDDSATRTAGSPAPAEAGGDAQSSSGWFHAAFEKTSREEPAEAKPAETNPAEAKPAERLRVMDFFKRAPSREAPTPPLPTAPLPVRPPSGPYVPRTPSPLSAFSSPSSPRATAKEGDHAGGGDNLSVFPGGVPSVKEKTMSRADDLNRVLRKFQGDSPGVEASALISEDGLMIASVLPAGMEESRIAGMGATLLSLGARASVELKRGAVREVVVRGEMGYVVMIGAKRDVLLMAVTNETSKLGMIFFDMHEAIRGLEKIL